MNVLVYVLDALRADHVSCYGYERGTTPRIDEVADEGIVYRNAFSPATWTKPVGASILTGAYPPVHGTRSREDVFNADITRLPEVLAPHGIYSVGFSTMGNVSESLGYGRGFDEYHDLYKDPEIVKRRKTQDTDSEELDHEAADEIALPRAEDLSEHVIDWLKQNTDTDFFAFCWSIEPHIPYDPPDGHRQFVDPEYDGPVDGERESLSAVKTDADLAHLKALYDGEIAYNDFEFGRIIETLKQLGIYDETAIVVLGDHGDAFNEHGQLTHGHLPYDELAQVPLILKPAAAHDVESQSISELCSLVDVAPTIMAACGIDEQPETVQGRPLLPYGPRGSSAPVFSETVLRDVYPAFYSVRTEAWKYMEVDEPDRDLGTIVDTIKQVSQRGLIWEILRNPRYYYERYRHSQDRFLFDLDADPEEHENLVDEQPAKAKEMESLLEEWLNDGERMHDRLSASEAVDIDSETSEQLRQLGYVE